MSGTCCNTDNVNQLLFIGNDENTNKTLILDYSPYINWGRWNHNPSRLTQLIEQIHNNGYNVQLNHLQDENDSIQGNISIKYNNNTIVSMEQFQHNSNSSQRPILINYIVDEIKKHFN